MINCIIVDDDKLSCKVLEGFVRRNSSLNLLGIFGDSISARNVLTERNDINLVFLDIQMPEMDGFDFIDSLGNSPNIILVTSSDAYAIRAFDVNVVDYLLKPVAYARFCKAIDKLMKFHSRKESSNPVEEEIFIKKGSSLVKIKIKEIMYVEALENYVTLVTGDDRYTIHFTMKAIENHLPHGYFVRVHRSYIVNKGMIQAIKENSLDLKVKNDLISIPVGKSYRDMLLGDINVMAR